MIFMNYRLIMIFIVCAALLTSGIWGLLKLKHRKYVLAWLPARLAAIGLIAVSSLLMLLFGCGMLVTTSSKPFCSPDRSHAIRITDHDEGATGGGTTVDVFWDGGLHSMMIFNGGWKQVEAKDVRWVSNSKIIISYSLPAPEYKPELCQGFAEIEVTCLPVITNSR